MHVSASNAIAGKRVLHRIGRIKAASVWRAENGAPLSDHWREAILRDLIRKAEDFDADAIIGLEYEPDRVVAIHESGVKLTRWLATGIAVKLSCAV
jgi:uncharacterized protein YbjQ (UPF0145 family)